MADLHGDKGVFLSVLDELSRPGEMLRALLAGKGEGAARQLGQFGLNLADSALPGDWLPNDVAREEDYTSGKELLDLYGFDPGDGVGGSIAGFGVEMLTDPLTYVPGAVIAKGAKGAAGLAKAGASKIVGPEALDAAGSHLRKTFGALKPTAETAELAAKSRATGVGVKDSQARAFAAAANSLPPELRKKAFWLLQNVIRSGDGQATKIVDEAGRGVATDAEREMAALLKTTEEAGRQVDPMVASEYLTQVKKPNESRGKISDLDTDLGISGMAYSPAAALLDELLKVSPGSPLAMSPINDVHKAARIQPIGQSIPDQINEWKNIDDFRAETLDEAYPIAPTDPLYANGVDMANNALLNPATRVPIKRFGPDQYPSKFKAPDEAKIASREAIAEAKDAARRTDPLTGGLKAAREVAEEVAPEGAFSTVDDSLAAIDARIAKLGVPEAEATQLRDFFGKRLQLVQDQYAEAIERGALYRVPGVDHLRQMPKDYVHRMFDGLEDTAGNAVKSTQDAAKERSLRSADSFANFLNDPKNAKVTIEDDIGVADLARADKQGRMAQSAMVSSGLIEKTAQAARNKQQLAMKDGGQAVLTEAEQAALDSRHLAGNESTATVKSILQEMRATGMGDDADILEPLVFGMKPRGTLASVLAKGSSFWKPAATGGYLIPKLGFQVRNRLSTIWQTYSNEEARGAAGGMAKRFVSDLIGAIGDGVGIGSKDELGRVVNAWDDALTKSGGSYDNALALMAKGNPDAAELIKNGVMDGFVRTEEMLSTAKSAGLLGKAHKAAQWPGRITKGVEDRARLGLGLDLVRKQKMKPAQAAEAVREALFDYSISSTSNRAYRDAVPFGQYMAKAIPQQAEFLTKNSPVRQGIANAMSGDDESVMPYMEGKLNIPVGDGEFISGLGLPFEALSSLPNPSASLRDFGRQIEKNIVGSAQPLLKSAFATVSGEDPYFGSEYGGFSKLPGGFEGGEVGRLYNQLSGAGLPVISQFDALARTVGKGIDDRKSPFLRGVDLLTGANVVSVDEDMALQQRLSEALARDPDVMSVRTPINTGNDPDTQAMINELRALRKTQKEKRQAELKASDIL